MLVKKTYIRIKNRRYKKIMVKCPYVNNYECDNCRYCKTPPHKKGGLENWNMLEENISIKKHSANNTQEFNNIDDFLEDFDREFIHKHEDSIIADERTFEDNNLDGGLLPTSESLTRDFNRIFKTNYKNIFKGE